MAALAPVRGVMFDRAEFGRQVLLAEAEALRLVADRIGPGFEQVIAILLACRGRLAVTGVGKSADVGQKIVSTLNSTGTRAYALDVTRAVHGDLGMVAPDDVALLLSHSGESEELLRLLPNLRPLASAVVAVTGNASSSLVANSDAAIVYGPVAEACPNSLAPSTSTTVMIALGDAIAFTLSELRGFTANDFARVHPAGSLGRKLATVEPYMRCGDELRIAPMTESVRAVFARGKHEGRRTGAIILVDGDSRIVGIFTDSDLAKLFERNSDGAFDRPISEVMTKTPISIRTHAKLTDAIELMRNRKVSEVPVVDAENRPIGMLDITDLIGMERGSATSSRPALRLFERPAP